MALLVVVKTWLQSIVIDVFMPVSFLLAGAVVQT